MIINSWLKTVVPIAAIFSFRMLGLFMLIPVFTVYANGLNAATPALIGIAFGIYGLSQGMLQIPFGMLSDRFGRKPVLTLGLVLFAIGSLIGANSHSIYTMMLARALQGAGAIGSVLIALMADLTTEEQRTRSMAVIGMTIGLSFSIAMIVSPILAHAYGLSGIFYLTVLLAIAGLILLFGVIPTPAQETFHQESEADTKLLRTVLRHGQLLRLDMGIFCQHLLFTATFFAIPIMLHERMDSGLLSASWHFYLPIVVLSFLLMVPFIILAEKKQMMRPIFLGAIVLIMVSQLALALSNHHWLCFVSSFFCYMVAFNFQEAALPSLVSKTAPKSMKGTAMGVYSTSQFCGFFVGGMMAGALAHINLAVIFAANTMIAILWFIASLGLSVNPKKQA